MTTSTTTVTNLLDVAKKLSHAEQVDLLDKLAGLVDGDATDLSLTPGQREDLNRRIEEFRSGNAKLIPGEEAFARLRQRR